MNILNILKYHSNSLDKGLISKENKNVLAKFLLFRMASW